MSDLIELGEAHGDNLAYYVDLKDGLLRGCFKGGGIYYFNDIGSTGIESAFVALQMMIVARSMKKMGDVTKDLGEGAGNVMAKIGKALLSVVEASTDL